MQLRIPLVQTADRLVNQLQQAIRQALEPAVNTLLGYFETTTGSFTAYLTGCTASVSGTAKWQWAATTGQVTLTLPELLGTSNTAAATIAGLPVDLRPLSNQYVVLRTTNSGTHAVAVALIGKDGTITLYKDVSEGAFTASGTKGLKATTVTYGRGA